MQIHLFSLDDSLPLSGDTGIDVSRRPTLGQVNSGVRTGIVESERREIRLKVVLLQRTH